MTSSNKLAKRQLSTLSNMPAAPLHLAPRQGQPVIYVVQQPVTPERPSHYAPMPRETDMWQVARYGIGALVALLGSLAIGQALIHQANMNYLNYSQEFDRVNNTGHRLSNY